MTEIREIELNLLGRSCFSAALSSDPQAPLLKGAPALEKERIILSVVSCAHELLDTYLADGNDVLTSEERLIVDHGISLACEEWLREPLDAATVNV